MLNTTRFWHRKCEVNTRGTAQVLVSIPDPIFRLENAKKQCDRNHVSGKQVKQHNLIAITTIQLNCDHYHM